MNLKTLKDTEFFKTLLKDRPQMKIEVNKFNIRWGEFWSKDREAVGRVLISHLCVEYYLERYIVAANPGLGRLDKARLSFSQKMALAYGAEGHGMKFLDSGLRALNKVRNELAHNINARPDGKDLQPMRTLVRGWNKASGRAVPKGIDVVSEFARIASLLLFAWTNGIARYGQGKGAVGYHEWLKKAL